MNKFVAGTDDSSPTALVLAAEPTDGGFGTVNLDFVIGL